MWFEWVCYGYVIVRVFLERKFMELVFLLVVIIFFRDGENVV